ncbi:MAG TPA: selenium cofactor biosynthesis protein YqeC [Anaerolineaceae bacterium]|nr:selenium cofactor biosynthesis protein YqeC [Anaerolineaceae bacterium]
MKINEALRIENKSVVAFVGAGGKTTAMFNLAREFDFPSIVTTTTKLGLEQIKLGDKHINLNGDLPDGSDFGDEKVTVVTDRMNANRTRWQGLDDLQISRLRNVAGVLSRALLIEADGAKTLPLKAPGEDEPIIPDFVDQVIVIAGLGAVGNILDEGNVFRPALYSELSGQDKSQPVSLESIARMLINPMGGLKGIPENAKRTVILNHADLVPLNNVELAMFRNYLIKHYHEAYIGSLHEGWLLGLY